MKRFSLFFGSLSLGARLQFLVVIALLGFHAWIDSQRGFLWVTGAIFLFAWLIGWLLLPLMMANPRMTTNVLGAFGIIVLSFYVFARQGWWWRTVAAHYAREFVLWLDLSCSYWFKSEMQLKQEPQARNPYQDGDAFPSEDHGRNE